MSLSVAVLMDPIEAIHVEKDSTFAMLLEAQRRGHEVLYLTQAGLAVRGSVPWGHVAGVEVRDDSHDWFTLGDAQWRDLRDVDVILARKDPPFDQQFLYDTMVLELAQRAGVLVVNDPQSLRDANEKLYSLQFPQCIPPTLIAREPSELRRFAADHDEIVLKPLDGMGGQSIFRSRSGDPNLNVILETLTGEGRRFAVAQRYLPEIAGGDRRILLVDGEPVPYLLARMPQGNDFRGNLARGGKGVGMPLNDRERWIAAQVGPELSRRGMLFVVAVDWCTRTRVPRWRKLRPTTSVVIGRAAGRSFSMLPSR